MPVLGPAPGVACLELLGGLIGLALAQDRYGFVIDGDDTGPAALGRPVDALACDDSRRALTNDKLVCTWAAVDSTGAWRMSSGRAPAAVTWFRPGAYLAWP